MAKGLHVDNIVFHSPSGKYYQLIEVKIIALVEENKYLLLVNEVVKYNGDFRYNMGDIYTSAITFLKAFDNVIYKKSDWNQKKIKELKSFFPKDKK